MVTHLKHEPLSEARITELKEIIAGMKRISSTFYSAVIQLNCHAFIEFTGLMNEYIKICEDNLAAGIDFTEANAHSGIKLLIAPHQIAYFAEKLDCIFGPALRGDEKVASAFIKALHLELSDVKAKNL